MTLRNKNKPSHFRANATQDEVFLYEPVSPASEAISMGWAYPANHAIALSSLGYMSIFAQLDQMPTVNVQRLTMDNVHLFRTNHFDLIGFSFSFELDIFNILNLLETLGVPLKARDRTSAHPVVFAGGPVVMTNPEPYSDFFDCFLIGEGEGLLQAFLHAYEIHRTTGHHSSQERENLLHQLALEVPGVYVPSLYEVTYDPQGPIQRISPKSSNIPFPIQKRFPTKLTGNIVHSPILSPKAFFPSRFLVEVMRGCSHRCRFCLASYSMLPARPAELEDILNVIDKGLSYTNHVGLVGALIADHPEFSQLCGELEQRIDRNPDLTIASASLRADTLTPEIVRMFYKGHQKQLTIAVESGTERLRRRINKNLSQEKILDAAAMVSRAGLRGLKIYGMVGLPDETDEDISALVDLLKIIKKENPALELSLGCSSFVPKAWTPFQWTARLDNKLLEKRVSLLKRGLVKIADVRPSSVKWDFIQALLSRGDRRLSTLLLQLHQYGSSWGSLQRAYKDRVKEGSVDFPPPQWYALRERPPDEILPWDVLQLSVSKEILYKEGLPPLGLFDRPAS